MNIALDESHTSENLIDRIFLQSRSLHQFLDKPVTDEVIRKIYDLAKWAPTGFNAQPARFLFLKTPQAKNRLAEALSSSNRDKSLAAPVNVIIAWDSRFHYHLPEQFPAYDARTLFETNPSLIEPTGKINAALQTAFFFAAARTLGLDVGPMSGFSNDKLDTLWFTRCAGNGRGGVPTATGIASQLGWLQEEFAADGIRVRALQDEDAKEFRHNHYDHELKNLIREGGNLFAIPAKAQGAKTRLIGLTWIEEGQFILVRKDSDIKSPKDLQAKRLSLPVLNPKDIAENKRGRSISRYMSLQGYKGALNSAGLSLDDIQLVETGGHGTGGSDENSGFFVGAQALLNGEVDGLYVKGGSAVDKAQELGLVVGIDLDKLPERRFRVNNGTPRPITVHEDLLENHFDIVVRFLAQTLRAAEWAKTNLDGVYDALHKETGASRAGLETAYRDGFHLSLAPDLSAERVELFRQQKDFLLKYGVLDRDFDYDAWIDYRPIEAAQKLLAEWQAEENLPPLKVANS